MNSLPRLPLEGEPDGRTIHFGFTTYGMVRARVVGEDGLIEDVMTGHSFREAYDKVRDEYPHATWSGEEEE